MFCCYYPVDVLPETEGVVPIGKPIPNCRFYVLDRHLNPVPIGVPGELYIGGVGVARGYLNNLEMTDRSFIRDPWNEDSDARIYKSGDLVRYRPDGNLEILGRLDQQVKIRGCRVEMEEVEAVMRRHPQVQEAVVIASGDDPGALRLAAYFVPKPDFRPTPEEWRRHMSASLPGFMVPSFFTPLAALPITPNGKVDRKALPPPGATPREEAAPPSGQRNPVESDLVRIWEDELGIRPVGVRDNFFDLGGHSLLAASLFARIEKVFGRRLPLATLFSAPTIELLAQRLQDAQPTSGSSLVAIRSQGDGYPVFWVHTLGGHILLYERLARYLASNRPIYALKPVGIDDGRPPHARIEDMAAHYLSEIRAVQPAGPYWLGGQSFGGLAAFEMACQLQKRGEKVAGLLILDTYAPGCDCSTSVLRRRALRLSRWLDFHRVNLRMMTAKQKPAYLLERLTLLLVNIGVYPSKNLKGIINIYRAHARARHAYSPQVYPGRITLFRASRQPLAGTADPQSGWGKLAAQGVEVHEVPGSHSSIIVEPHVRTLAAKLQTCLEDSGLPG
jgi:thioesterase domain-containing protein/acyl carrier protein